MAKYRKIDPRIWNDVKFRSLGHDAQYIFMYLLTSPHSTAWGAYVIDDLYIQADTGMSAKRVSESVSELLDLGLILRCKKTRLICFPNWFKFNRPENERSAKACLNGILSMPKSKVLTVYCNGSETVIEMFANNSLTMNEMLGCEQEQEQEQEKDFEQEQEQEQEQDTSARSCSDATAHERQEKYEDVVSVLEIPLIKRDGVFNVTQQDIELWQETYPGIDSLSELRKIRQWNIDNPKKRKTKKGIRRHISGWLENAQNQRPFGTGKCQQASGIKKTARQKYMEELGDAIEQGNGLPVPTEITEPLPGSGSHRENPGKPVSGLPPGPN